MIIEDLEPLRLTAADRKIDQFISGRTCIRYIKARVLDHMDQIVTPYLIVASVIKATDDADEARRFRTAVTQMIKTQGMGHQLVILAEGSLPFA